MNTHILIFSCIHDLPYLEYCLRSIEKFATGFTGVTVAVVEDEREAFREIEKRHKFEIKVYTGHKDKRFNHVIHQGEKCLAHEYVPQGTDLVLFKDSDCIFTGPVSPETYIVDGLPELLIERFDSITGCPWQKPTEEILMHPVDFECMRRHPMVAWVSMFPELKERIERLHSMEFREFIKTRESEFPWKISDFNLIGNFILLSEWFSKYHLNDITGGKPHPDSSKKLIQFWSRSPIYKPQSTPWNMKVTPLEVCRKLGL